MGTTAEEWARAEPVVLPWQGEETGWTLQEMVIVCPKCGGRLAEPRGRIYESLGVVEVDLAERCQECGEVRGCRERLCPKQGVVMRLVDGEWRRFNLTRKGTRAQEALKRTLRVAGTRVLPGYGVGVVMGLLLSEPTLATYGVWAGGFFLMLAVVYLFQYWAEG